jgi:hypothetical protein
MKRFTNLADLLADIGCESSLIEAVRNAPRPKVEFYIKGNGPQIHHKLRVTWAHSGKHHARHRK